MNSSKNAFTLSVSRIPGNRNFGATCPTSPVTPGAAIERNITKAGSLYKNAECDLIDKMLHEKDFDLKKIKEADLPEELKKLKADEREPYLKKKAGERAEIQKTVTELSTKRAKYIDAERAKQQKVTGDKAFDQALREILKERVNARK